MGWGKGWSSSLISETSIFNTHKIHRIKPHSTERKSQYIQLLNRASGGGGGKEGEGGAWVSQALAIFPLARPLRPETKGKLQPRVKTNPSLGATRVEQILSSIISEVSEQSQRNLKQTEPNVCHSLIIANAILLSLAFLAHDCVLFVKKRHQQGATT